MVVGTTATVNGVSGAGSAILYDTSSTLLRTLVAPKATLNNNFGYSVDLNDKFIVVGVPDDGTGAVGAGVVHVFNIEGTFIRTIKNPRPAAYDWFGWRVKLSGDYLVVASIGDNIAERSGKDDAGTVDVFSVSSGKLLRTLNDSNARAGNFFGSDISVDGTTLLVGSYGDDTAGVDAGSIAWFNIPTGRQLGKITNPTNRAGSRFGYSVYLKGGVAYAGAPTDYSGTLKAGRVTALINVSSIYRCIMIGSKHATLHSSPI